MKEVLDTLQEIQSKAVSIESRLKMLGDSISGEEMDKAISLIEQQLLEVHKLENLILTRKIQFLERKLSQKT